MLASAQRSWLRTIVLAFSRGCPYDGLGQRPVRFCHMGCFIQPSSLLGRRRGWLCRRAGCCLQPEPPPSIAGSYGRSCIVRITPSSITTYTPLHPFGLLSAKFDACIEAHHPHTTSDSRSRKVRDSLPGFLIRVLDPASLIYPCLDLNQCRRCPPRHGPLLFAAMEACGLAVVHAMRRPVLSVAASCHTMSRGMLRDSLKFAFDTIALIVIEVDVER